MTRDYHHCTALLFDGSHADAISRLFVNAHQAWTVFGDEPQASELLRHTLDELDALARSGTHIVLSLSYEAYAAFSVADHLPRTRKSSETPWLQALAFDAPQKLNRADALAWLSQPTAHTHLQPAQPSLTEAEFVEHIQTIRALIAAGDTYQVNYTFPLRSELIAHAHGDAALAQVYHQLVRDLKIPYGAFLTLPHNSLLSFSPELFIEMSAQALTCRPMKGTAAVADNDVENTRRAAVLAADPKNRAENLMIVDLMRNDLSRLHEVQKVTVPKLFEVKRYGAVLQMTSTVKAHLSQQPRLSALFDALFPCGSITGAPKHRTIEIIDAQEPHARGAYCGAIGFIEPINAQHINAVFSVPIRTLETSAQPNIDAIGAQHWPIRLSVGAGITFDSDPQDEWQESLLKAKFLTQHTAPFELIETMRAEHGQIALLAQHHARLCASAGAMGWKQPSWHDFMQVALKEVLSPEPLRVRVTLDAQGVLSSSSTALEPIEQPVRFAMHAAPMDSTNPLLRHKTSARTFYNQALADAKAAGLFDYVFLNERGEISEGARSCIFILRQGQWLTPPLTCGVLPGVQRAVLLDKLKAQEQVLRLEDVVQAEQVMLCNALYGALDALMHAPTSH